MVIGKNRRTRWITSLIATTLFLMGCETDHHDYIYNLKVSTSQPVNVSYQILDEDSAHTATLENGDLIRLCKRNSVAGDDIWDIETSSTIYKIESLVAYTTDSSSKTENMNRRTYWSASPMSVGDSAFYTAELTDQCFILDKQSEYGYNIASFAEDSIVVTCIINGTVVKDTLFGSRKNAELGKNDIYVYNGNAQKSEQDKRLQKLSGMSSISLKLKKEGIDYTRTISLQREDSLFTFTENECTLNIKEWHFNLKKNNKR